MLPPEHHLPQSSLDAMQEPFAAASEGLAALADRIKADFPESVSVSLPAISFV